MLILLLFNHDEWQSTPVVFCSFRVQMQSEEFEEEADFKVSSISALWLKRKPVSQERKLFVFLGFFLIIKVGLSDYGERLTIFERSSQTNESVDTRPEITPGSSVSVTMPFYGTLTKHVTKETTVWKSNTNSAHIKCVALELVSDITNRTRVEFMFWYFLGLGLVWTEKMRWPKEKYDSEHLLPDSTSVEVTREKQEVQEKYYDTKKVIYSVLVELVPPLLIGSSRVTILCLWWLFSELSCRWTPDFFQRTEQTKRR